MASSANTQLPAVPLTIAVPLATAAAVAQTDAQKGFAAIKTLPGTWEGNTSVGPLQITFKVTAGGSAVMSEILNEKENMVTMFNLDGARLVMTHYCALGNQPRMKADPNSPPNQIRFLFTGGTNLDPAAARELPKYAKAIAHGNPIVTFTPV